MEQVRVSVIVPTRNRPDQIGPCVESILANSHPSMELIVIDQSDARDSESALVAFRLGSPPLLRAHLHARRGSRTQRGD